MEADVIDLLERACRTGTGAMKARSRKLLAQFRKDDQPAEGAALFKRREPL